MKKNIKILVTLTLLILALTGCGQRQAAPTGEKPVAPGGAPSGLATEIKKESVANASSGQKVLIAYFSWADNLVLEKPASAYDTDASTSASVLAPGNVTRMAGWIQQETGGDLFAIKVTEPYSSDYDKCLDRAADEKAKNSRPALTAQVKNIDDYDVIFLGYPNWWYTAPMAIFSFIETHNLSGKKVILFCSHGTGGLASSVRDIRAALPNSTVAGNVLGVYRDDVASSQNRVRSWLRTQGY